MIRTAIGPHTLRNIMSVIVPHSEKYIILKSNKYDKTEVFEKAGIDEACIARMQASDFSGDFDECDCIGMFLVNPLSAYGDSKDDVLAHSIYSAARGTTETPAETLLHVKRTILRFFENCRPNCITADWLSNYPFKLSIGPFSRYVAVNAYTNIFGHTCIDSVKQLLMVRLVLSLLPVHSVVRIRYTRTPRAVNGCQFNMHVTFSPAKSTGNADKLFTAYMEGLADVVDLYTKLEAGIGQAYEASLSLYAPELGFGTVQNGVKIAISNDALIRDCGYIDNYWKGDINGTGFEGHGKNYINPLTDSVVFLLRKAEESGAFTWRQWGETPKAQGD